MFNSLPGGTLGQFLRAAFFGFLASSHLGACSAEEAKDIPPREKPLAFPGAIGFGKHSAGGRGGEIFAVTNLNDSGPGSLRECIEANIPRVCVFRVGGVIRFTSERPIIRHPFITIAGQTAPGDGILITHNGGEEGLTPIAIKNTHDVVIRHIRVRTDKKGASRGSNDAFTIENSYNVILDHVSGSWAIDENVDSFQDNDAVTISWSVFAEGIPPHDKCALLGGDSTKAQSLSFLYNLCAHNGDRNPDIKYPDGSCIEVVNNTFYNAVEAYVEIWELTGGTPVNIVGNYFKAGPNTADNVPALKLDKVDSKGDAKIYSNGNFVDEGLAPETETAAKAYTGQPVCPLTVKPLRAEAAHRQVVSLAGALPHDAVDRRIRNDVINRTGAIAKAPGELPRFDRGVALDDVDQDGMADGWERTQGIDETTANPWGDQDSDGWTNLDEYLHYAHRLLVLEAEQ
ncbi:MAG: pectate lyase [Pseudomonadota bacterium]